MSKISYPNTSAYAMTPQSNFALGVYQHRTILPNSADKLWTIEPHFNHRPDLKAAELYGDSALYWVFMARNLNVIRDPLWGFKAGLVIYLPSPEYLKRTLKV
jgi:hypothetical protein